MRTGTDPARTVGVDLAADPARTGLAVLTWTATEARVEHVQLGATDADVVAATGDDAVLGLDCPVGWPDAFVDFVVAHRAGERIADGGPARRRELVYRATDRVVRARTGRWPLSVSADRLGVTAMRGAALLTSLADAGVPVDRSARSGRVFEVYPGAALRLWGFDTTGYRVDPARRRLLLDALVDRVGALDLGGHADLLIDSGDAFDAVIAGIVARAAALGRFVPVPDDLAEQAGREGWVVLPDGDLGDLFPTGRSRPVPG